MYRVVKEYVRDALKNCGFRVKTDFFYGLGWVDVVGFKRNISVAVDISDEPYMQRIESYPFDATLVICGSRSRFSDKILLTDLDSFHKDLRKVTGFDCMSFEEWQSKWRDEDYEFFERSLRFMRERYGDIIAEKLIDALVYIYMAGELIEDYSGKVRNRIPYSGLFPNLVDLGLLLRDTKELYKPKTFMVSLTREGFRIAKFEIYRRIEKNRDRIKEIVRDIGRDVVHVILVGLSDRRGLGLKDLDFEGEDHTFYDILPRIDVDEVIRICRSEEPLKALCRTVTYTALFRKAQRLFKELIEIGLAIRFPVYDYYGSFFGYEYRIPKEVMSYISTMTYLDIDMDFVRRFQNIMDMSFLRLRRCRDLDIAVEKGIVRLREGGIEVLDWDKFKNFIRIRIGKVISDFLNSF